MIEITLQIVGNTIAISLLVPLVIFIIKYWRKPWKTTPEGINAMLQKIAFTVVILFVLAGLFLPQELELVRLVSRIAAFTFVAVVLWLDLRNLDSHGRRKRLKP